MNSLPYHPDSSQPHSTLAPSERHLEDWVVANQGYFAAAFCNVFDNPRPFVISRQPNFPIGRPDLIMHSGVQFTIVELKKGAITFEVLGQCARYIHDMREIAVRSWLYTTKDVDISTRHMILAINAMISGCVVGHSIADPNIPFAAQAMSIEVLTYEWHNDEQYYSFNQECTYDQPKYDNAAYEEWAGGGIGIAIHDAVERYISANAIGDVK